MSALHLAVQYNQFEIIKFLVSAGADVCLKDESGIFIFNIIYFTASDYANENGLNEIYQYLLNVETEN